MAKSVRKELRTFNETRPTPAGQIAVCDTDLAACRQQGSGRPHPRFDTPVLSVQKNEQIQPPPQAKTRQFQGPRAYFPAFWSHFAPE